MNITLTKVKYILKVLFYFYTLLFHCYHQVVNGEHHPEQRKWWQNNNNNNNGDSKSISTAPIKRHSSLSSAATSTAPTNHHHFHSNHQTPKHFNNSKYIEYFFNKQMTTINPIVKKNNLALSFIGRTTTTTTTTKPSFTKYPIRSSHNNNHHHHRIRHNNYLNSHLNRNNNYDFPEIITTTTPEPTSPIMTTTTTTTTTPSTTNWNDFFKNNLKSMKKLSNNNYNYRQQKYNNNNNNNNRNSLMNVKKHNSTQLLLLPGNRQLITTNKKTTNDDRIQKKIQHHRLRRPIKYRNPYDILQIPYKDRIYPIKNGKSTNTAINYYDYSDDADDDEDDYDDENSEDNKKNIDDDDDQDYYNFDKIFGKSKLLLKSNENNHRRNSKFNAKNNYADADHMTNFMRQLKSKDNNNNNNNNGGDEETDYTKSYIPGTLTNYKFQTLGTHSAVKKSRQSYMGTTSSHQQKQALASAHASKIYAEASCKWPKPKIISVQNDPSKTYLPHCTILHRCGDDTGCCNTDTRTCVERHSQNIDLYFYVSTLGSKQGSIEKQTFVNHTECHCVDKILYLQSLTAEQSSKQKLSFGSDNEQYNFGIETSTSTTTNADNKLSCKCPKEFENVLQSDMLCRCDCSISITNNGCDWMKKGKEHFSMADRKCIMEERCKMPTCEYGSYDKRHGKCPKKEDKLALGFSFNLN